MATESDIRKMLIDVLRPSIRDVVQQELGSLKEIRAQLADATAEMHREIAELRSTITQEIAARTSQVLKDLERHMAHEVDARSSSIRQQFVLSTAELHGLRDDIARTFAQFGRRVDALEQRLSAAAAALAQELRQQSDADEARPEA
jgi:predicted phage tail protein